MFLKNNNIVAQGLSEADGNVLRKDKSKKEGSKSIFFYSKIVTCTLLIWASQCSSNSHTNFSSSHDEAYTAGSVEYASFHRSLALNERYGKYSTSSRGPYMPESLYGHDNPSSSRGAATEQPKNAEKSPCDLNTDIETKLKDLKDVIWDKVENAVEWGTLAENVKSYLGKMDSNLESKIVDEVNKANRDSNLMEKPDAKTKIINGISQNYTVITPPLFLLLLSILPSETCKKHLANILLTSLLVAMTYVFFKLKKIDDNKEQNSNANLSGKNDSESNGKKSKDKSNGI
ncbi:hypothetical protein AK88_00302 [Plasmodium fragile]|uniref:Uncharacterized protein n=1 Tax=Plasmodium fragile TaxID=5857 RepID=A0A0D9QT56_PLAFR|nr:uncharacterized protein AK88_00302 [Plasmodium fragile]KJP90133.1 hypothetical protein AK88_00302 [Plasmodium fragile]